MALHLGSSSVSLALSRANCGPLLARDGHRKNTIPIIGWVPTVTGCLRLERCPYICIADIESEKL